MIIVMFIFVPAALFVFLAILYFWGSTERKLPRLDVNETNSAIRGAIIAKDNYVAANSVKLYKVSVDARSIDKNKLDLNKKLTELTTLKEIYNFSYENIVNKAKNVDAIWFNRRNLPDAFYEIEHSTDFKNSLNKFYELQDFNAKMFIVADLQRKKQFDGVLKNSIYESISKKVKFACYEDIVKQYEKESEIGKIPMGI